jgi:hypothetical protein
MLLEGIRRLPRNGDRNVFPNFPRPRKIRSQPRRISVEVRKIVLAASQFFAFLQPGSSVAGITAVQQQQPVHPHQLELEAAALARIGAMHGARLACQTRPNSDISVMPCFPRIPGPPMA